MELFHDIQPTSYRSSESSHLMDNWIMDNEWIIVNGIFINIIGLYSQEAEEAFVMMSAMTTIELSSPGNVSCYRNTATEVSTQLCAALFLPFKLRIAS
jgi:hypothetical protein